ncbi:MAG: GNAT family N-acetyltransferase [Pseudomonadota bacterium]|jgi:RimJ/RimL family protein N-acetyltransferase|uniref:N-acetylglutamate synthase n=1 Tax=hydrothermal vent metagenome TaxID=652676 RepID=A0A160TQ45_9ZZZZ
MFDFQPTLSGDLLTLRPQVEEDWDALFAVASDPAIWAMHPMRERYREPVFRKFFEEALADHGGLVARDRADNRVFGFSRYSELFTNPGEVEIGWTFLACDRWGGGWNREMKRLMLTHAFGFYDTVIFRIGDENFRSRKAVEKIGGVLTDRVQEYRIGDAVIRHVTYAIAKRDFTDGPLA